MKNTISKKSCIQCNSIWINSNGVFKYYGHFQPDIYLSYYNTFLPVQASSHCVDFMTWRIIFVDYILIIIAASGNNLCTYLYSWVVTQPHFKSSKRFYIFQTNALVFISALSFHCFHSKIGKNFTTRNCQFWFYREKTKRVCFILHIRRLKIASQNKK